MKNWVFQAITIQKDRKAGTGISIGYLEIQDTIFTTKAGALFGRLSGNLCKPIRC